MCRKYRQNFRCAMRKPGQPRFPHRCRRFPKDRGCPGLSLYAFLAYESWIPWIPPWQFSARDFVYTRKRNTADRSMPAVSIRIVLALIWLGASTLMSPAAFGEDAPPHLEYLRFTPVAIFGDGEDTMSIGCPSSPPKGMNRQAWSGFGNRWKSRNGEK